LIGNPGLKPEQTISYEVGLQGAIRKNINVSVNSFFKD
jgi:outer membrane receptor for ferrienterochelin and colicin